LQFEYVKNWLKIVRIYKLVGAVYWGGHKTIDNKSAGALHKTITTLSIERLFKDIKANGSIHEHNKSHENNTKR
jgi:hypothetical protein